MYRGSYLTIRNEFFQVELYYGPNLELLGYKQDFKMNAQFSMATGTIGDVSYFFSNQSN